MSGKMYRASSPLTAQLQCTCGAAWWLVTEAASGEFVCPTTNLFTDEAAPASKPLCFHVTVYVGRLRPAQWDTSLLLTLSPLDVWPKQIYKTSKCSVCTTVTGLGWDYFSLNWPIIGVKRDIERDCGMSCLWIWDIVVHLLPSNVIWEIISCHYIESILLIVALL